MIKIAYCDDSAIQRELVEEWLADFSASKDIDVECTTFEDGTDLVEFAKENGGFDIYILDIILPGIKGTEVAEQVKDIRPNSKIIFLTAHAAFENRVQAFGYLIKPVRPEKLTEMLDKAIAEL